VVMDKGSNAAGRFQVLLVSTDKRAVSAASAAVDRTGYRQ
jgi:hypothetical protein